MALVVLPGADAAVSEATSATLRSSGAAVVSTTSVDEDWVTSDEATAASRDAAVTAAAAEAGVDVSDSGSVAPRDVLLASLLTVPAADPSQAVAPATAQKALDALASADLIQIDTEGFELADLVVVVSGVTTQGDGDSRQQAAERWVDLVIALDTGPPARSWPRRRRPPATASSVIRRCATTRRPPRASPPSTTPVGRMGQASVVHALKEQAARRRRPVRPGLGRRRTLRTAPGVVTRVAHPRSGRPRRGRLVRRAPRAHRHGCARHAGSAPTTPATR